MRWLNTIININDRRTHNKWCFVFCLAGAVFNFVCGDRDAETMRKIELYFQTETTEVYMYIFIFLVRTQYVFELPLFNPFSFSLCRSRITMKNLKTRCGRPAYSKLTLQPQPA